MAFQGISAVQIKSHREPEYPTRLSLYIAPPLKGEIRLEDLESAAMRRLAILREIEHAKVRMLTGAALQKHMEPILRKHMPLSVDTSSRVQVRLGVICAQSGSE